ncbi:MAG: hypothetical protein ABI461_08475, partial [Polyangiaceae bacterium]
MHRMFAVCTLSFGALAACGGAKPPAKTTATAAPSASAAPVAQSKATGFLSTTVPMAAMPPDFDFGSKKAEYRVYPADNLAARSCATGSANGNLASDVAAIGKVCATPTKLHPLGNVLSGTQKADALAQRFPLTAQAGHCYRVYGSAASTITDFSV